MDASWLIVMVTGMSKVSAVDTSLVMFFRKMWSIDYEQSMNYIFLKKAGLDVMQRHTMCFSQYQTSSAALG